MSLLLDTHALVWWVTGDPRLSAKARSAIEDASTPCFVSAVSAFEIANKVRVAKLPAAREIAENMTRILQENGFSALPVFMAHSLKAGLMQGESRDPFDRLLAAQSLIERMPLVTRDSAFRGWGVETMW